MKYNNQIITKRYLSELKKPKNYKQLYFKKSKDRRTSCKSRQIDGPKINRQIDGQNINRQIDGQNINRQTDRRTEHKQTDRRTEHTKTDR